MLTQSFQLISPEELELFLGSRKYKAAKVKSTRESKPKNRIGKKAYAQVYDKDGYKYIPIQDKDDLKLIVKTYKKPKYRKNMYSRIYFENPKW